MAIHAIQNNFLRRTLIVLILPFAMIAVLLHALFNTAPFNQAVDFLAGIEGLWKSPDHMDF